MNENTPPPSKLAEPHFPPAL